MKHIRLTALILIFSTAVLFAGGEPEAPPADPTPVVEEVPVDPREAAPPWDGTIDPNLHGWWNETVFYEVYVRSFRDSNADQVGDLQGLIDKLDYLNDGDPNTTDDLGVTGIWLMPIQENNTSDPHGYHVIDYYKVEEDYGTKEDFLRLMEEAKKRGIKVIIDLVINHTGKDHPWFQAALEDNTSPYHDYYVWSDTIRDSEGPWGQNVWHSQDGGETYYYGVFNGNIPDLNFNNPAVTEEIKKITQYWVEEMGVDGFRIDAVKYLVENEDELSDTPENLAWFEDFYQFYKGLDPELFTVGEVWSKTEVVAGYAGNRLDTAFEFDLADEIIQSVKRGSIRTLEDHYAKVLELFPDGQYATFLTNHDQTRVMNQIADMDKMKQAASILLTGPGVPFLYYGEELGLLGEGSDTDKRRPMQWDNTPVTLGFTDAERPYGRGFTEGAQDRTVANQTDDPESLLSHYRNLIHLRNSFPALQNGKMVILDSGSSRLWAILRYTEEETALVLVNLSTRPQSRYGLTLYNGPFTDAITAEGVFNAEDVFLPVINDTGGFEEWKPLEEIPPKTTVVIKLK
jgi:alpha-amylase